MTQKTTIWIGLFLGSWVGSYLPTLFGASLFSGWSITSSAIFACLGVYIGYKVGEAMF